MEILDVFMDKILFLANIQHGEEPTGGGVQTRNQIMLKWLSQHFDVKYYDTWGKSAFSSLIISLCLSIFCGRKLIVISYGGRGALALVKLLKLFRAKRMIKFFVPGGDFLAMFKQNDIKYWADFNEILIQSKFIVNRLRSLGLNNVTYCPNFKVISYRPTHNKPCTKNLFRFVYVGRLVEEKGIQIMIDACRNIKEEFVLTIYGKETEKYNRDFFSKLNDNRIVYKGYINLKTKEGYDELAAHDVLIFPTFLKGEGYSGTLIDAFICGLPIIATDFQVNSEIIENGVNGVIIPPRNPEALSEVMRRFISGEEDVYALSNASFESAKECDINNVMGEIFKEYIHKIHK